MAWRTFHAAEAHFVLDNSNNIGYISENVKGNRNRQCLGSRGDRRDAHELSIVEVRHGGGGAEQREGPTRLITKVFRARRAADRIRRIAKRYRETITDEVNPTARGAEFLEIDPLAAADILTRSDR